MIQTPMIFDQENTHCSRFLSTLLLSIIAEKPDNLLTPKRQRCQGPVRRNEYALPEPIKESSGSANRERFSMNGTQLTQLLATYGYGAVLLFIMIESTGIPFPGEAMLLIAAIAAGMTHQLAIPWVIAAATTGAILGDNLGFWIGQTAGYQLLRRYGRYIRLDERKLKLGRYLFLKHGSKVVFFGRFVAVLRAWAAF